MSSNYYILVNDQQKGPYSKNQIREMWIAGNLNFNTKIWSENDSSWVLLSSIEDELAATTHVVSPNSVMPPPLPSIMPPPLPSIAPPPVLATLVGQQANRKSSPIVAIGFLFFLGLLALFFIVPDSSSEDVVKSYNDNDKLLKATTAVAQKQVISNILWDDLDKIYNLKSKNTDLQKDELWKHFEGKRVKWKGEVTEVSNSLGRLVLQVKMNESTFTSDIIVTLKDSQSAKAIKLKQGDSVTFVATLDNWGTILPISMNEGEIVE
jgi:hypothetical protein